MEHIEKKDDCLWISFYCYYRTNITRHFQKMNLTDIPNWISAYKFTHPDVKSISAKVYLE